MGLASDRTDGDGQPLRPGRRTTSSSTASRPPSRCCTRAPWPRPTCACLAGIDREKLLAVDLVTTWGVTTEKSELARARARAEKLESVRVAAGAASLEDAGRHRAGLDKEVAAHRRFEAERAAFAEAEKRLLCEGLLDPTHHIPGVYDTPMRLAMLAFQQKNVVMAQGDITRSTLEALARPPRRTSSSPCAGC